MCSWHLNSSLQKFAVFACVTSRIVDSGLCDLSSSDKMLVQQLPLMLICETLSIAVEKAIKQFPRPGSNKGVSSVT